MSTPFKLGFFASFAPPAWHAGSDRHYGGEWWTGDVYVDLAKRLEAAKVDFLFFEDTSTISRASNGGMGDDLKLKVTAPKHDPMPLLPVIARETGNIGLIATASTTFYPPFILSRLLSTIDSMSGGRIGWNIVTSYEATAAQNFGLDDIPPHDVRYEKAHEFVSVAKDLWQSWDADALVQDEATNTYVDATKVHEINHRGKHFSVRGPINVLPSPQGTPVLVQAGTSPQGRDFGAQHAEIIFAIGSNNPEQMKSVRDDIRGRAERFGRNPDDVKVLYSVFAQFVDEDHDFSKPLAFTEAQLEYELAYWSTHLDLDLKKYPSDRPLPAHVAPEAAPSAFGLFKKLSEEGHSIAEALSVLKYGSGKSGLVDTPENVADHLIKLMDEVGGDGFMLMGTDVMNAQYIDDVTNKLVPRLQQAGVFQTEYSGATFRESLRGPTG